MRRSRDRFSVRIMKALQEVGYDRMKAREVGVCWAGPGSNVFWSDTGRLSQYMGIHQNSVNHNFHHLAFEITQNYDRRLVPPDPSNPRSWKLRRNPSITQDYDMRSATAIRWAMAEAGARAFKNPAPQPGGQSDSARDLVKPPEPVEFDFSGLNEPWELDDDRWSLDRASFE
jgi:hypothetical protein